MGTGMEFNAAVDAGDVITSEQAGVVTEVSADRADLVVGSRFVAPPEAGAFRSTWSRRAGRSWWTAT